MFIRFFTIALVVLTLLLLAVARSIKRSKSTSTVPAPEAASDTGASHSGLGRPEGARLWEQNASDAEEPVQAPRRRRSKAGKKRNRNHGRPRGRKCKRSRTAPPHKRRTLG